MYSPRATVALSFDATCAAFGSGTCACPQLKASRVSPMIAFRIVRARAEKVPVRKLAVTQRSACVGRDYSDLMRRVLLMLLFSTVLRAAEPEKGKLVENIATRLDPTQSYTLYLPSSYDATKKQPLLLVFDPRQRGTVAANIYKDAAEEFGWILISSNLTRSDD